MPSKSSRILSLTFLIVFIYLSICIHTALFAPFTVSQYFFSEAGAIETFSPWLWYLLGFVCLFSTQLKFDTRLMGFVSAVLLGLREMDFHKKLFEMSFIKTNFYRSSEIPLSDKFIGFCLILLMAYLTISLGYKFYISLRNYKKYFDLAYIYIASAISLTFLSKILDRMTSQLNDLFNIQIPQWVQLAIMASEESIEMLLPVLLLVGVLIYKKFKRD